jgi:TolB protein
MKAMQHLALLSCVALCAAVAAQPTAVREVVQSVDDEPYWSPDGLSFVFVSNRNGPMNLYRIATSGGAPLRLTSHAGPDDTPAWSPDGRSIAFVSEVDGNPEIYPLNADGSNQRRLTSDPGLDLHPNWSPDSRRILFNTSRPSEEPSEPDRIDICEFPVSGGDLHCFTKGGINTHASWSPDGSMLVFRRSRGEGKSQVVLLRVATGEIVELTPGDNFDGWPSWSPDGDRIVFASDRTGEFQLFVMNQDGSNLQRVLTMPGRFTNPRWSPKGDQIPFTGRSPGDGDRELYSIDTPPSPPAKSAPNHSYLDSSRK